MIKEFYINDSQNKKVYKFRYFKENNNFFVCIRDLGDYLNEWQDFRYPKNLIYYENFISIDSKFGGGLQKFKFVSIHSILAYFGKKVEEKNELIKNLESLVKK